MHYAYRSKTTPLTMIRRQRVLPRPGEVLVHRGDRVESTQVVARTSMPGDFRILAVGRLLGVSGVEAEDCLQIDLGDTVHRGDVVARRGGLLGRSVESPIDGIMTAAGGGRMLIEAQPIPFELHAHISGDVRDVQDDRVVSIETAGALIEAAWGSGGEGTGTLKAVTKRPDEPMQSRAVGPPCHGSIIVAGTVLEAEPLARAQDIEVRGIVTGGVVPELLPVVESLPFPTLVINGFGELAMLEDVFELLRDNEGREASVSGQTNTGWHGLRPEIVIPLPGKKPLAEEPEHQGKLIEGARVRIVRAPYLTSTGTVIEIPRHARRISTGARAYCANVDIGQAEPVLVPLVNLEILP